MTRHDSHTFYNPSKGFFVYLISGQIKMLVDEDNMDQLFNLTITSRNGEILTEH